MLSIIKTAFEFVKKRWYVFLIIGIGLAIFINQQRAAQAKKQSEATAVVGRQNMKELLSLAGEIGADEHVTLQFQTPGRLAWVGVKEGDVVKKYQAIASLDQRDVRKRLDKSLNTYLQTRNAFDQSGVDNQRIGDQPTNDWSLGDKMKRILENAQYSLNSSVLDVELNDLAIEYANLYSPIDGVVTGIDTKFPGVNITIPSQAGFEIINPKTLYFSFTADQTEITQLTEGLKGTISLDSFPDTSVSGELYYLSYTPKPGETGTVYEGRVKIPVETGSRYRFSMTGDVTFTLNEKNNVVVVEDKYIKLEGDKKFVWRRKNGNLEKTFIKTGLEMDGLVEILSGVEEGDVIVNVQT